MAKRKGLWAGGLSVMGVGSVVAMTAALTAAGAVSQPRTVGPQADGTAVLPNGWSVTPAGRQVALGEMPFGSALSPDGKTLVVSNDGQNVESLQVINVATGAVVQTIDYPAPQALYLGVAWSPDGTHVYASAGANNKVRVYDVSGQQLTETTPITTGNVQPSGLTVSPDGTKLYVVGQNVGTVSVVDLAGGTSATQGTIPVGATPYGVQLTNGGQTALVSNWGANTVTLINTATDAVQATVTVGQHPSAMAFNPQRNEVYVANSDSDDVSVLNGTTGAVLRQISVAPYPNAPAGSQPDALAVSPDGGTLYVADAGDNDVAVVHLAEGTTGGDSVSGLIPTAWYPSTLQVVRGGTQLMVTSAKGLGDGPNPNGPNPPSQGPTLGDPATNGYILAKLRGELSVVGVPTSGQLAGYTAQVRHDDGFNANGPVTTGGVPGGSVIPRRVGQSSPIKHVILVVKENRTYDQVLGDLGRGNGDPALTLFGPNVTPNQHQLAKQFVTLDNYYANGEVTNEGWNWVSAANSNTYNEKTTPGVYSFDGRGTSPSSGNAFYDNPGPDPYKSFIWDQLIGQNRSFRNYGFAPNGSDPALAAFSDPNFPGFNTSITDRSRIQEWQKQYANFEQTNTLPALETMELGDDHTSGSTPGAPTPAAQMADNDYALGQLVNTVSHSKDWASTAIFVTEDDAQDGPDHVDAHRTLAQVISPYTENGTVDSTLYSQVAMLHTMELILGLQPMSQFDAAALPMVASFSNTPNLTPYNVITPAQNMDQTNTSASPMAALSATWNFKQADAAPDALLNQVIWESVKGANSPMPAPMNFGVPDTNYYGVPTSQASSSDS